MRTALLSGALAFVLGLVAPTAARAEVISVPPAALSDPAASLPPPTVLRGSRPSADRAMPICPPGYTLSAGYGCIGPNGGDYAEGSPGYDYWPGYGVGYPIGGFAGFGRGAGRSHRFTKFHGFSHFHGSAHFGRPAKFGGFGPGTGHMAGFGRR